MELRYIHQRVENIVMVQEHIQCLRYKCPACLCGTFISQWAAQ